MSGKDQDAVNRCSNCVRCCVEPGIEVPQVGVNGEPLAELVVKSPGQCCPWIGKLADGILGCTIYVHHHRPQVCAAYVCEELASLDSNQRPYLT